MSAHPLAWPDPYPHHHRNHPRNLDIVVLGKRIDDGERIEGFVVERRESLLVTELSLVSSRH